MLHKSRSENIEFRRRFINGEPLLGTFIKSRGPYSVEIMAQSGFDFVIIDAEHAAFDRSSIEEAIIAARASGVAAIVRVAGTEPHHLMSALDDGTAGLMVPHVKSAEIARRIVSSCRYSAGRGYSNSVRAAGFGARAMWDVVDEGDSEVTVIAMIEDSEAIGSVEEILDVDGIDGVFIGRADLTVSMDDRSENTHMVRAATDKVLKACADANKPACLLAAHAEEAKSLRSLGVNAFVVSSDQGFMRAAAMSQIGAFKQIFSDN